MFRLPDRRRLLIQSPLQYKRLKEEGQGAYSRVEHVVDPHSRESFALKVMKASMLTARDKENITNELASHYEMDHPNIIRIFDHVEQAGHIYLLLEHAEGGNLFNFLNKHVRLEVQLIARLFYQSCKAVEHVHSRGFIHRDLKPENILLDRQHNVKLCDFGWCAAIDDHAYRKVVSGTYEYMSPETLHGHLQGFESDVWSLGVLLYELHHNVEPFKGRSVRDVLHSIKNVPVIFDLNATPEAKDLIIALLQPDPAKRLSIKQILAHPFLQKYHYNRSSIEQSEPKESSRRTQSTAVSTSRTFMSQDWQLEALKKKPDRYDSVLHAQDRPEQTSLVSERFLPTEASSPIAAHSSSNPHRNKVADNRIHFRPISSTSINPDSRSPKSMSSNRYNPISTAKRELQGFTSSGVVSMRTMENGRPVINHTSTQQLDSSYLRSRHEAVPSSNPPPVNNVLSQEAAGNLPSNSLRFRTEGAFALNYLSNAQAKKPSTVYRLMPATEQRHENKENAAAFPHHYAAQNYLSNSINVYSMKSWSKPNSPDEISHQLDQRQSPTINYNKQPHTLRLDSGRDLADGRFVDHSTTTPDLSQQSNHFNQPSAYSKLARDRGGYIAVTSNKPVLYRQNTASFGQELHELDQSQPHQTSAPIRAYTLQRSATFQL